MSDAADGAKPHVQVAGLHDILTRTVAAYERGMPTPWSYDPSAPDLDKLLAAIVGFRIEITRLDGKAKLSQNHPEGRRQKVIRALEARGGENATAVAALMAALEKK